MSLPDAFWAKVDKTETCWLWTATKTVGYGRFGTHAANIKAGRTTSLAYRMLWEDLNGPVPEGLELDHLCNTPACVNPNHLEPVTHQENMRRRFERRETCPNGHAINDETRVPHYDVAHGSRCLPCRRVANRISARRQRAREIPEGRLVPWDVRVWAQQNGLPVKNKGPLAKEVIAAYRAAQRDSAA